MTKLTLLLPILALLMGCPGVQTIPDGWTPPDGERVVEWQEIRANTQVQADGAATADILLGVYVSGQPFILQISADKEPESEWAGEACVVFWPWFPQGACMGLDEAGVEIILDPPSEEETPNP